jgi:uncharacterized protein (TIGR00251 family)
MMTRELNLPVFAEATADGWRVLVRVRPGAKRSEFTGLTDGRLCVRLAAPAVENKANKALLALVAKALGLRLSQVTLLSGASGREKRLHIATDDAPDWSRLACPLPVPK